MPSEDYGLAGGGALKLKGAKVGKKKKKSKAKAGVDKSLSTESESGKALAKRDSKAEDEVDDDKTHEESETISRKTESERRHDEVRKRKLMDMAKQSGSRPELLKTHKERVEELNTYLSKLSEHHDMPKIGPG